MEKLELICRIQAELSVHRDLFELRPRAALSFSEEEVVVQYRQPATGQAEVLVMGTFKDVMREERRVTTATVDQLRRLQTAGGEQADEE